MTGPTTSVLTTSNLPQFGLLERVDGACAPCSRLNPCSASVTCGSRISISLRGGVAVLLDDLLAGQRVERLAHRVLVHRLLELEHDQRAAREVDAERHAAAWPARRPGRR